MINFSQIELHPIDVFPILVSYLVLSLPDWDNRCKIVIINIMESLRQNKVSRLLQKESADIFQKEMRNVFGSGLITVTHVFVSSDLSFAKIYLSLYAVKEKEKMLKAIKNNTGEIRRLLGNRIGKQVRIIPELAFFIDESADYAEKIEGLLKNVSPTKTN